jgi:hypothetical protein
VLEVVGSTGDHDPSRRTICQTPPQSPTTFVIQEVDGGSFWGFRSIP